MTKPKIIRWIEQHSLQENGVNPGVLQNVWKIHSIRPGQFFRGSKYHMTPDQGSDKELFQN